MNEPALAGRLVVGVPVRNQLPYALACLETLHSRRGPGTAILIVDDASAPECAAGLRDFVARTPDAALLVNRAQRGVPYCFNEILYNSSAPEICLLNSDTLVTPGWDERLAEVLRRDESIGFVGASTSWAHTRQSLAGLCRIRHDLDARSVVEVAATLREHFAGEIEEMPT